MKVLLILLLLALSLLGCSPASQPGDGHDWIVPAIY
jgi:hypothetical protein